MKGGIAPGDSGSAWFVNLNGTYAVAGVTSGYVSDDGTGFGEIAMSASVQSNYAWLESTGIDIVAVPEPDIRILIVGGIIAAFFGRNAFRRHSL